MEDNKPIEQPETPPELETPPIEEPPAPMGYTEAINALKTEYDEKIKKLTDEYTAAVTERDGIIKQLLTGEETAPEPPTLADKINANRNFKKW